MRLRPDEVDRFKKKLDELNSMDPRMPKYDSELDRVRDAIFWARKLGRITCEQASALNHKAMLIMNSRKERENKYEQNEVRAQRRMAALGC